MIDRLSPSYTPSPLVIDGLDLIAALRRPRSRRLFPIVAMVVAIGSTVLAIAS